MKYFAHSINSIDLLDDIKIEIGVEIDIRDRLGELVLGHDPLKLEYNNLKEFLKKLKGRHIIANIKSERIEESFLNLLKIYSPNSEYFFLDSSFSVIAKNGRKFNFSSRFSEYESIQTSKLLIKSNLVNWIWVDTFTKLPINEFNVNEFNSLSAKKCLTSPDLLGREYDIIPYAKAIRNMNINFDAICCKYKNIALWEKLLA